MTVASPSLAPPRGRFALIGMLYVSQAIPIGFFVVALPVILRGRGASRAMIGGVAALALVWALKFAWAPIVDRYAWSDRAHYRSWIVPLQVGCVACALALAWVGLDASPGILVLLGLAFMTLSATQDVATDGLAVRVLSYDEHGRGNGIQVGGYFLGQFLGGGVALMIHARFGWSWTLAGLALALAVPILPALAFREPPGPPVSTPRPDYRALARFLGHVGPAWAVLLLTYRAGESMAQLQALAMFRDLGFSEYQIAVAAGMVGSAAALLGAWVGGRATPRLGRRRALTRFALLEAAALATYLPAARGTGGAALMFAATAAVAFAATLGSTALYTAMMDRARRSHPATDFSLQQSMAAFGPIVGASASGATATALGDAGHFAVCIAVVLGCAALARFGLAGERPQPPPG